MRRQKQEPLPKPDDATIWACLAPNRDEFETSDYERLFELYKMMVESSEALVGRRQGVNTFFLTANGALLTGIALVVRETGADRTAALGLLVLAATGGLLSYAWRSLLKSFGQLNQGKFAVINRLETMLPAAIYTAEWTALAEGTNPAIYRSFTSRELWAPAASMVVYGITAATCLSVILKLWTPG